MKPSDYKYAVDAHFSPLNIFIESYIYCVELSFLQKGRDHSFVPIEFIDIFLHGIAEEWKVVDSAEEISYQYIINRETTSGISLNKNKKDYSLSLQVFNFDEDMLNILNGMSYSCQRATNSKNYFDINQVCPGYLINVNDETDSIRAETIKKIENTINYCVVNKDPSNISVKYKYVPTCINKDCIILWIGLNKQFCMEKKYNLKNIVGKDFRSNLKKNIQFRMFDENELDKCYNISVQQTPQEQSGYNDLLNIIYRYIETGKMEEVEKLLTNNSCDNAIPTHNFQKIFYSYRYLGE